MNSSISHKSSLADLLLVNPAAGGGRAAAALPRLRQFAAERRWRVDITVPTGAAALAEQASAAAAAGRERILVLGGDGTFQVLINAVAQHPRVVLGVIPAGGGNDLAAALGLPPDPVRAAELLLEGEVCSLDVVRVRTADGAERFYTGGGGVGLDAEAARYAGGVYRNLHGRLRYLLSAIRALAGFHCLQVHARLEGDELIEIDARALLLGILNTPSYGAGLRLAPGAQTDDGQLDLVLMDDLNFMQVLALIPALASRGELRTRHVRRFRMERARIETKTPCAFHGDGEIIGLTPVEVEVVPRAIRVLRAAQPPSRSSPSR